MYSSRRFYNRPKSKQYYRKRRINAKFSPAAYKSNIPTFYQQKGRIIQTTPLHLYEVPSSLPNYQSLQSMYNTLLKAKYPNVGPQNFPLQPYVIEFETNISIINENLGSVFSATDLLENIQNKLTPLPNSWHYKIECFNINFQASQGAGTSSPTQYHLDLHHPILTEAVDPIQLIFKTVTTSSFALQWNTNLTPTVNNQLRYIRASYTTGGIGLTTPTVATIDDNVSDNGWYPILSTDYSPDDNYLECVVNSGTLAYNPLMTFSVLCTPVKD